MLPPEELKSAYVLMTTLQKNVRLKKKTIRKKISPYSTIDATRKFLKRIRNMKVLFGPELWVNSGFVVELIKNGRRSSLALFDTYRNDDQINYAIACMGVHSLLAFKKGASILKNAICVTPTYPGKMKISDIELTEKGEIARDEYPHNWNDLDWSVFSAMRKNPGRSYGKAGGELGVSWVTVREHLKKILNDCKVSTSFYPKGYNYYQQALLRFKTKYERNLWKELKKIDRSSFLYKYNDSLILILFYEDYTDLKIFDILKKERKIKNLEFSTPIAWD